MINNNDRTHRYGTRFINGLSTTSPGARYSLGVIIVHELGHGYQYYTQGRWDPAMAWENLRHSENKEPLRPDQCHGEIESPRGHA